jgi:hypothetical protein
MVATIRSEKRFVITQNRQYHEHAVSSQQFFTSGLVLTEEEVNEHQDDQQQLHQTDITQLMYKFITSWRQIRSAASLRAYIKFLPLFA